mmetsp:Transcript_27264/g.97454  ORF Transcript_27264/g.97454 Transcript_27264/m.97454 type:complete len:395 (+) Transcript_27264:1696-2880(+)
MLLGRHLLADQVRRLRRGSHEPPRPIGGPALRQQPPQSVLGRALAALGVHDEERPRHVRGLCVAARLLAGEAKRPFVAIVGDERHGGAAVGLVQRAALIEALIDVADEICLGGRCALECLAAAGVGVGRKPEGWNDGVAAVAKQLMAKALRRGVRVRLPCDFATGDVLLDEHGAVGVSRARGDDAPDDAEKADDGDDEGPDASAGFDYDGEAAEHSLAAGLPKDAYALDVGPRSIDAMKSAVAAAGTVLWCGLVGHCECSAFQAGCRDVMDACVSAHEDRGATVVVSGAGAVKWLALFTSIIGDDGRPSDFGGGETVAHAADADGGDAFERLLCGHAVDALGLVVSRAPQKGGALDDETLLDAELRALAQAAAEAAAEAAEDDEDDDDDDDDED